MAIFCTQCGSRNDESASFCEHCGAPRRRPAVSAPEQTPAAPHSALPADVSSPGGSRRAVLLGAAVLTLLLTVGAAAYYVLTPPAATSSRLLAAARDGYGQTLNAQYRRELCLSNLNYGVPRLHVAENDDDTQTWLNALVTAGLYEAAVPVTSGSLFPQTLMQYVAKPALAQWREGTRLCLARGAEIAEVVDIGVPREETVELSGDAGDAKLLTVTAQLVMRATQTAPWLEQADLQAAALAQISDWEYRHATLQRRQSVTFGLHEGQWTTGPADKAAWQKPYQTSPPGSGGDERIGTRADKGFFAGLGDALSGLFSVGGHPLTGTWRMDAEGMAKSLGMNLPGGLGLDATIRFTSTAMEMGGESIECKFQVEGQRVRVTPQGQPVSLIFVMQDEDTASVDMGLFKVHYKRVD